MELFTKQLSDLKSKANLADVAISWREAILDGRYARAGDRMTDLIFMIDEYRREGFAPDENPHTVDDTVPGLG